MRWMGRRESGNVEDRRGDTGGGGGFGGMPGGGLGGGGFPVGRAGGFGGIGIIIVILIGGWLLGINPLDLLNGGSDQSSSTLGDGSGSQPGQVGVPADEQGKFVAAVLADTEDNWTKIFSSMGKTYTDPTLVLFSGSTSSACGFASAATGPFYCPNDQKLYIDLAFYKELSDRFKAPGDAAEAYVIAHEVGHHVQNLLGILPKVDRARQNASEAASNQLSIKLELQADCFAGVWAHAAAAEGMLEPGDMDQALTAAAAVGDDNIQKRTQGYVVPESFNHGTSEQRSRWLKRGYDNGTIDACDTFSGPD